MPVDQISISFLLKRGTLIGAALGMLAGMIVLAIQGVAADQEISSIIIWRNCILIGAGIGFISGALAWQFHFKHNQEHDAATESGSKPTDN